MANCISKVKVHVKKISEEYYSIVTAGSDVETLNSHNLGCISLRTQS